MDTKVRTWFSLCVLCVLSGEYLNGQVQVGAEARRDRLTYHFDNPSSVDTPFTVPHFFEQRYVADNVWLVGSARYTKGVSWETAGGLTPRRLSTADDYDTFFNPGGTVIVSGTTGGASVRAFRFSQLAEAGRVGPLRLVTGYRFRLDRTVFHLGHKTVTRNAALVEALDVTTRETTSSQQHAILARVEANWILQDKWRLSIAGDLAPVALGRLLVQLPDKYPGRDLVYLAKIAAGSAHVMVDRAFREWKLAISADAGTTWSYRRTARLDHQSTGAQISIGRDW